VDLIGGGRKRIGSRQRVKEYSVATKKLVSRYGVKRKGYKE